MFDDLLSNIRFTDLLDIAILSYVIYRLLLLIRGTRAFQMVGGLLLLIPIYGAAKSFGLYTLSWILDRFSVYLVLTIVILFQDDVRRALARVGNPFFSHFQQHDELLVVEELARAAFAMADGRVGALIAIQGEASLGDYADLGVRIDAKLSHEVLQAIFQPTSPIHDGAVIVQKDRIASAGSFLPLTTHQDVSKALGTRHRAALGLSEETDAVILVVSEEEGRVSLVQNGKIRVMPDAPTLRQALSKLFAIQQPKGLLRFRRVS